MRVWAVVVAVSVALLGATPAPVAAKVPQSRPEIALSFAPVVKVAAPAVVNIFSRRVVAVSPFANDPFFSQFFGLGPMRPQVQNSLGSGVIVRANGLVVTNHHVIEGADEIRAVLNDGREFDARVVLSDAEADIAVLRLEGARDLPTLGLRDSDTVEVGDLVLAIGDPFGVGQTVSSGIVSGTARSGTATGNLRGYYIQTDAPINPGNSGGALVDMAGRLIGINTAILTRSGGSNGIGFAIPANLVAAFVAQAEAGNDRFIRPWAGITGQPVDAALAEAFGLERPRGMLIDVMHPDSPFAAAGLKPGDIVVALDGKPVNSPAEMLFRMSVAGPGARVKVSYLRDGRERQARVTLIAPPEIPPRDVRTIGGNSPLTGATVANVNPAVIDELNLPTGAQGVVIVEVAGIARRAGFQPGDILLSINGTAVTDTRSAERLGEMRARRWVIEVLRKGQRLRMAFAG